jgi:tetratricopeptide (TPR) repeat protein
MAIAEPASPHQLEAQGKSAYQQADYGAAAQAFAEAAAAYAAHGEPLMAAEMQNNRCVALLQGRQAQAALEAASGTEAVFAAAGDLRRQGMALANLAAALEALRRRDEALACYQTSAGILEQAGEKDLRADVLRAAAGLQARRGRMSDAVITMQSGLMGLEKPTLKQRILKKLLFLRLWR